MEADRSSGRSLALPNEVQKLLEAAKGPTEEKAWSAFLGSYSRLILYVARQMPGDHDVIMDRYAFVVEHLRELSYRRLRTYAADGRGKFTTWLTVVARRLCIDHNRLKYGRAPPTGGRDPAPPSRLLELVLDPDAMDRFPDGRASADDELDRKQVLERLEAAIATLSPNDQLLVVLRYRDGRSAREIASLVKLTTPFHVYRRLSRVHLALREAMRSPPGPERRTGAGEDAPAVQYRLNK